MKFLICLFGLAQALTSSGLCGNVTAFAPIDPDNMEGEWYPMLVDRAQLDKLGLKLDCLKVFVN